jgi:prephenate dehydrogenase
MAEQIRLGLIGYGEIGSTLGRGLRGQGLENIVAYDRYAFDGPYSGLIQRRAQECSPRA